MKRKPKSQASNGTAHRTFTIIWWVIAIGVPLWLTYFLVWRAQLALIVLEPLDKASALTSPFELANGGTFDIHNVRFIWIPRNAEFENNSSISGFGELVNGDIFRTVRANEKVTVKSPLQDILTYEPLKRADLEVIVSFRSSFLPFSRRERFRFVTAKDKEGIVRWYNRPLYD